MLYQSQVCAVCIKIVLEKEKFIVNNGVKGGGKGLLLDTKKGMRVVMLIKMVLFALLLVLLHFLF